MGLYAYQIRVHGHLNAQRLPTLVALHLEHTPEGETLIRTAPLDQAALHALLSNIRDLGLTLIALQREENR
ncbi:MAG: hypothetical protein AB4911_12370 [Oscillochloridaceae bacterium umkhey_bin13]